jgi:hypothetical protein
VKLTKESLMRKCGRPSEPKKPLFSGHMRMLVTKFEMDENLYNLRFITMCLLPYAGFLCFDEVVRLKGCYVDIDENQARLFID